MLELQNSKCAICLRESDKRLAIDHAHTESEFVPQGMIRGLLCNDCNRYLIGNKTDPTIFERAAEYLKQHTGKKVPE